MNQLTSYIQSQLDSLLREVQKTPPRSKTSLKKIKALVDSAPITNADKQIISQSIRKVQSAIKIYCTPPKKNKLESTTKRKKEIQPVLELSYSGIGIKKLVKSKLSHRERELNQVNRLQSEYLRLKQESEAKEQYLQELIVRVQRHQRMQRNRARSALITRQHQQLNGLHKRKQQHLQLLRRQALGAAKQGKGVRLQGLMREYCKQVQQKCSW